MLTVSGLFIYPIKSLAGIEVDTAVVTTRGLQHDRRLMLVDDNNMFLTQREHPVMALLQPVITNEGLYIHHKREKTSPIFVPALPPNNKTVAVTVWEDTCQGQLYDADINGWFSEALQFSCRLVYMPDTSNRQVDRHYAQNNEITSFADGYPILIIGQSSLDDLNTRLAQPLPMNRFRPNIVFTGGNPFLEDQFQQFTINDVEFRGVKPCARCLITTIDQHTIAQSKEPLHTLAGYRKKDNKILFGHNLLHNRDGRINVGDTIVVTTYQPPAIG